MRYFRIYLLLTRAGPRYDVKL